MAWTTPGTAVAGDVLTASFWNANVRDNLNDHETRINASGLTFISTTTFSASATMSFTNVFSSTYTNYKVICNLLQSTTAQRTLRFRDAGGAVSTALYSYAITNVDSGTSAVSQSVGRTQTGVLLPFAAIQTSTVLDIIAPNASTSTTAFVHHTNNVSNSDQGAFAYSGTTAFTGFDIILGTGTITGTVSIYGYHA